MSTIETPGASRELQPADHLRIATCTIRSVEVRDASANGDGSWTMSGYAAVFDTDTVLYDGNYYQVIESIDPGAFTNALASPDLLTHFNFGHDQNRAMASTKVAPGQVGSLALQVDPQQGLYFLARVDPEDPDAQALAVKMRNGVIDGASFAFTIKRQQTTTIDMEDGREQDVIRILEVGDLYDVCACAQGAYREASSTFAARTARSYGAAILGIGQPSDGGHRHQPSNGGDESVSGEEPGASEQRAAEPAATRDDELDALRRRAALARHTHTKVS
jgi:HK97 family phage prohead protease